MKHRAITLLAVLVAGTALAEPVQPQGMPPMMVPAMQGGYNPYMMMPYGMPAQPQMAPMPYGMQMPQMQPSAYPLMPIPQQMPQQMQMPQMVQMPFAMPAPAVPAAPTNDAFTALSQAAAPVISSLFNAIPSGLVPATNPFLPNTAFNPFNILAGLAQPTGPRRPYEMRRIIEQPEKTAMIQMMLPMTTSLLQMGMPDAMNYFARKIKAKPGLTFEEVRESLMLRANQTNMKFVGENLMWKDFHAVLDDKASPRMEVLSFCDIAVARDLLKLSPEFIVFLPCRIAIMEDADKNIWLLTVDWDMKWVAGYEQKLGMTPELLKGADSINQRMIDMMNAAANGDL